MRGLSKAQPQGRCPKGWWIGAIGLVFGCGQANLVLAQGLNPAIKVGIVQRFGQNPTDQLTIQALSGDQLKVWFKTGSQLETVLTSKIEVNIQPKPFPVPEIEERLVLGTHRSFETAETKARAFQAQGIAVEIAQPQQWQVWADRDRYKTPEDRAQLLQQLQQQGHKTAYLDQRQLQQFPQLSWVMNGYRYHRDIVSITSTQQQFQITRKDKTNQNTQERYGGQLRFQPNTYGTYTLVNQVPIETYLRGVVPYEIGFSAPRPAIQAQAIIARTYALRNLRRFAIDDYQLCADTQCQVYKGLTGADPVIDQAIAATAGQVLTYQNELVDALYSSTTGGVTAAFEDVWEGLPRPYLRAKIDAQPNQVWDLSQRSLANEANFRAFINLKQGFNEDTWQHFRWQVEVPLEQVNQSVRTLLQQTQHPLANFSTIQQLQVLQRAHGGRVQKLKITTDLGVVELTKDEILRGLKAFNSLLFYVDPQYKTVAAPQKQPTQTLVGFTFAGGGLGHAVGLSQSGTYRLSRLGWSAPQILGFYYPGTQVQPLTKSIIYWKDPNPPLPQPSPSPQSQSSQHNCGFRFFGLSLRLVANWLPFWQENTNTGKSY